MDQVINIIGLPPNNAHPVVRHYDDSVRHKAASASEGKERLPLSKAARSVEAALSDAVDFDWLGRCRLPLNPGLVATFMAPLSILDGRLRSGDLTNPKRAKTIATALWICLAIQDRLGEDWDLGGTTFLHLQAGAIIPDPDITRALAARDVQTGAMPLDDILSFQDLSMLGHQLTVYDPRRAVVFYQHAPEVPRIHQPPIWIVHLNVNIRRRDELKESFKVRFDVADEEPEPMDTSSMSSADVPLRLTAVKRKNGSDNEELPIAKRRPVRAAAQRRLSRADLFAHVTTPNKPDKHWRRTALKSWEPRLDRIEEEAEEDII
ncbi:hypothetical protein FB45DRAFT_1084808 [Roridomyces roridus]|uniref:Uncharacterized protein n=1 Tax=Roridomyces roridus TaxID=1738132 RepID=A0AAD7BN87_9AGAR|nr:hypothetical protein FB45DRAFT_1084808 [Roridomyces roridus]